MLMVRIILTFSCLISFLSLAQSYRDILSLYFFEELQTIDLLLDRDCYFMQDGAPAHTALATRDFLRDTFGNSRVIGKFFGINWPARSPDLNVMDYFLWGYVKELVYVNGQFNNVGDMSEAIINAFDHIRQYKMNFVKNACRGFWTRVYDCINKEGRQLPHR